MLAGVHKIMRRSRGHAKEENKDIRWIAAVLSQDAFIKLTVPTTLRVRREDP